MLLLSVAVLTFAAIQLLPSLPSAREALACRFGPASRPALGVASALSLLAMIVAWRATSSVALHAVAPFSRVAGFILVLLGFIALGIALFRGRLRQILRWPMPIAITLWALGHLLVNGDLAGAILFGGVFAYGTAAIALSAWQGVRPSPEVRAGHDLLSVLAGVAIYGATAQLHGIVAGVPVLNLSR